MRRRTLIFSLALLACLIGFWCLPRNAPHPTVVTEFLGFTNSGVRQEALFALSNPPNAAVSLHSIRRVSTPTNGVAIGEAGDFSWARKEQWGLAYAISVDSTNEPLRVVFQFQQRAIAPRRVVELVRELWGRLTGNERAFFHRQSILYYK